MKKPEKQNLDYNVKGTDKDILKHPYAPESYERENGVIKMETLVSHN